MNFSIIKNESNSVLDTFASDLSGAYISHGCVLKEDNEDVNFVLNLTSIKNPKIFRRRTKSVFVISIVNGEDNYECIKSASYNTLIKTLSNLLIYVKPPEEDRQMDQLVNSKIYYTTPEAGFYCSDYKPEEIYGKTLPIASASFATDNKFVIDLPENLWRKTYVTEKIKKYGKVMNDMGILPTPFPLRELLNEKEMRHLYRIFGITGASYGNLSARENIEELGDATFWMTGRGVDKSNLSTIGRDILLVKKFDYDNGEAILSVPPDYYPKARVSVDAVEHAMIYETFPEVGAIVHVHAWMEDIPCTRQNYPCGTVELAEEVVGIIKQTPNPARAVVGLKNHGLTITGYSLEDIFDRIAGRLKTEVEMFD